VSAFFDGIVQRELWIREHEARSPLFYRDAHVMGGLFTADLGRARALLPTERHHALSPFPGRAVVALHCLEYRHSDIGPYNEVSLAIAVAHGRRPLSEKLALARAAATGRYHAFVAMLPVTTEAALHGGIDVFGYPKFLADIAFTETDGARTCTVRDPSTGELIVEIRGARIATRRFPQDVPRHRLRTMSLTTYPQKDGATLEARLLVNLIEAGVSIGPRMELRIGTHERAGLLRDLGLGLQLQHIHAPRCEAILTYPSAAAP
jgi:hypothetical protein